MYLTAVFGEMEKFSMKTRQNKLISMGIPLHATPAGWKRELGVDRCVLVTHLTNPSFMKMGYHERELD